MNIFITGGAGFIGSNFIRYVLDHRNDAFIVNFDNLTYAGNLENLTDVSQKYSDRYVFYRGDICDGELVRKVLKTRTIDVIINFAAETHVDRSIISSDVFIQTNIIGTKILLDAALDAKIPLFIQISTDEIYGSLGPTGKFTEESQIKPNSPYSASKAAADHLVRAYYKTYGLPAIITRCSNNYGPYQFPEKFIPLFITNALEDKPLPLYGSGKNIRDWIFVDDHSAAVLAILQNSRPGEVYNIGGGYEKENRDVAEEILTILGKPMSLLTFVTDRPGHDLRYAMDYTKINRELNWRPQMPFDQGLGLTIDWYKEHTDWVNRIKTKEYLQYYELNYGFRRVLS